MITLKEFQASRQLKTCYSYLDNQLEIEVCEQNGLYYLTIGNYSEEHQTLGSAERFLYDWAKKEGYLS